MLKARPKDKYRLSIIKLAKQALSKLNCKAGFISMLNFAEIAFDDPYKSF